MPPEAKLSAADHVALIDRYSAHNYKPLPVVIAKGEGVWVTDVEGKRYMDLLAAYSALNFGHSHPELVATAKQQLEQVTLTSRAFYTDGLGPLCRDLAALTGMEAVLLMNTGAEAVETGIKTARKWGYQKKKVAPDRAKIIVAAENFHGRTTTIVGFSSDPQARADFGPFTPGFVSIPYGDAEALERAIDEDTVAFLVEPIQGEAGVIVPPAGYLRRVRELCTKHNVLWIDDEIQAGLGRTGKTFACEHEGVQPDLMLLGKALGGGIVPVSAVVARWDVMDVFKPGDHGSTFGGNPFACALAHKAVQLLQRGELQAHATAMGEHLFARMRDAKLPRVKELRGRGLWMGIQLDEPARPICEQLMHAGVLCKDTHKTTIRLAPPLVIQKSELDWAIDRIIAALR